MPLSVFVEVVAGVVLELFGDMLISGTAAGISAAKDAAAARAERAKARALAAADVIVLAAGHDHKVTEAEREELAREVTPWLTEHGVDVELSDLLERWSGPRMALGSDASRSAAVRRIAEDLDPVDRARAFAAVVSVLRADERRIATPDAPFRERPALDQREAVRLFGEALGVPHDAVERAIG